MNLPDPLKPYVDLIRWGVALLLVMLLLLAGHQWGAGSWKAKEAETAAALAREHAAHQATKKSQAAQLEQLAAATAAVAAKAKAASNALAADRAANDNRYNQAVANAKRARSDLAAALRRGDLQLQPWWSYDPTGALTGGPGPIAGGQDGYAELRTAGLLAGVQDGADADAWITWLQTELVNTRRRMIEAGYAIEASP